MSNDLSGVFCPACKMKNEPGAILCAYCNTPMEKNGQNTVTLKKAREVTGTLPEVFDDVLDVRPINSQRFMDFEIPEIGIVLINLEDGQPIAFQDEDAFVIGRASEEIKMKDPLVDLTDYDAFSLGISRKHAMIRQAGTGYQIIDLESSNGTWHENQRLVPKQPYPIESGDRIRLGRLNILVFYSDGS